MKALIEEETLKAVRMEDCELGGLMERYINTLSAIEGKLGV